MRSRHTAWSRSWCSGGSCWAAALGSSAEAAAVRAALGGAADLALGEEDSEGSSGNGCTEEEHEYATQCRMEQQAAADKARQEARARHIRDAPGGSQSLALQQHVGTWVGIACLQ